MPQVFQVLRCYKCMVFQVHQVKKAMKWECKMCGEKQSRKRNYGIGAAKDCRGQVQKLNGIRGDQEQNCTDDEEYDSPEEKEPPKLRRPIKSKWSNYTEEEKEDVVEDTPSYINDTEVVLDVPKKKPRKKIETPMKPKSKAGKSWGTDEFSTDCDFQMSSHTDNEIYSYLPTNIETYTNNEHNSYETKSVETTSKVSKKSVFVPPKVMTNSKWADYVEDDEQYDENYEEHDESYTENFWDHQTNVMKDEANDLVQNQASTKEKTDTKHTVTKPTSIFTLCDDTDLDSVLDF